MESTVFLFRSIRGQKPEGDIMKKKETAVESGAINITSLCRNSIDLVRYARGLAVRNINYIEIMTNYVTGIH